MSRRLLPVDKQLRFISDPFEAEENPAGRQRIREIN